ncbi:MAG: PPC domain-containing DNA-binding protein [Candidatus Bruticola sp.]
MQWKRNGELILVTMVPGDKLKASILQAAKEAGLKAAVVSGLGGVRNIELGLAKADLSGYDTTSFAGSWELVNLTGNISTLEGEPFLHAHAALGGVNGEMKGGHLIEAEINVTAEIFLLPLAEPVKRSSSPYFDGIKVWSF